MKDPVTHDSADYRLASAPFSHRDGVLRADDFDDLYFSRDDGLGEARHVFLDGNDLAGRITAASQFTIAETGFGTGLNFLAVMALLEASPPKQNQLGCQIDYISFESRPLPPHHWHRHKSDANVIGHAGNHGDAIRAIAAAMRQSDHGYGSPDREMPDGFAP